MTNTAYLNYLNQTELMLQILPHTKDNDFALKGGTAINFFYYDMPRLLADIDLTFLKIQLREETLNSISNTLKLMGKKIKQAYPNYRIDGKFLTLHTF